MDTQPQVALVTGASSGIGRVCALHLAEAGYKVYGTSRRAPVPGTETPNDTAGQQTDAGLTMIRMDVHDGPSVNRAVDYIVGKEGRLNILVNNAGTAIAGALEETSHEEAMAQFETNFFGQLRVTRAVLPAMRRRGSGKIVNISSLAGIVGLPYQSMYCASKFALEGAMEALRMEVAQFGIHVSLIEPGNYRTNLTDQRRLVTKIDSKSPYDGPFNRALEVIESDERNGPEPEKVAQTLLKVVRSRKPKVRYTTAKFPESLTPIARRLLPDSLISWVMRTIYRLDD